MKITITKDGKVFKGNTLLKPRLIRGYLKVKIEGSTYSVHRLVAMTYIPNPENKPCVCHKDNNRTYIGVLIKKIPNNVSEMVGLNPEVEIYLMNLVLIVYFMSIILVNPGRFLKRNLGFLIQLLLVL